MGKRVKNNTGLALSDEFYDFLKYAVQYILPGVGTLYFTIAKIWGLPSAEEVVGTLAALATFGGILIGLSKLGYKGEGDIVFSPDENGNMKPLLELNAPLEEFEGRKNVQFKVTTKTEPIDLA